jgi:hypothetical protein
LTKPRKLAKIYKNMESITGTVYPAEWPGFPGENSARRQARADLRVVEEGHSEVLPADALAINEVLKTEEAAAFNEADQSPIYDYEIEMQRPLPALDKSPNTKRVNWRKRARQLMTKAN